MADTTYINESVYNKQGANTEVIASGGKIEIESGGELEIQSGASLDLQSGFNFYLAGSSSALTVDKLNNFIRSETEHRIIDSTAYSLGVVTVLSASCGKIQLSFATGCTSGTIYTKLAPPVGSGAYLKIYGSAGVGANAIFWLSDNSTAVAAAGLTCFITNGISLALSSILFSINAYLELRYVSDTTWAVIRSSNVREMAAA